MEGGIVKRGKRGRGALKGRTVDPRAQADVCALLDEALRDTGTVPRRRDLLIYVDQHYWLPLYSLGAFATQREEQLGYRPTAGNQGRIGALREPLPCWSAFTEGHVTAEGKLSACCFDATTNWTMGDLTQVSFMDAWNSEKFAQLRAAHLKRDVRGTVCENCIGYG